MSDITTKVSVVGEAIYPHLSKPDVRFNEHGEYKVTLKVAKQDASAMVKEIDQAFEDNLAKVSSEAKGKKVKAASTKPYKLEGDNVFFKYKMRASGINKKTNEKFSQRPALFDAKKNPISPTQSIWGGSLMKVAYQLIPYNTPMLGAGVSARLKAAQIIKLVEGQNQNLFKEEDGFEAPTNEKTNSNAQAEIQASSDF
ncbi:single-stranded DNA-binding protein [uncultured phage_Deep-GF0-KM16-C193]|uniref:Single-stranded DNA-binding protein n=1 Tax=uncultured phage_Deep-GF0-KM16-C193 TaxID=2740799 RepID=A0A1B1IWQ8_9CAUD|nr:single-stranded DNA-binding protein [uncultured phage_Deep-GF0-KM16-C193]ANS05756.1 single-stranded DNA-binding protein [uncultured phage_Deep-GF0-KM16-C193]